MTGTWSTVSHRRLPVLLIALISLLPAITVAGDDCHPHSIDERATVRWVIDGDTIVLADGRHLRFIGYNAPERAHRDSPAEPLGDAAWRALKSRIPRGSILQLEFDRQRHDRHGRLLAHAFLADGTNLQAAMLRDGWGLRLTIPPDLRHQSCYASAEWSARRQRRGLWSSPHGLPMAIPGSDTLAGRFRLTSSKVIFAGKRHGGWTLQLVNGVMLRIGRHARHRFAQAKFENLKGARVLARGYLYHSHGRLWLNITHPDNLQIQH
jgi:endonuclease YncB( thermonuclease family)